MTAAVVFSSRTGNTRRLAECVRDALGGRCVYFGAPDAAALAADIVYVGFWTDKGTADEASAAFFPQLAGKTVRLFGTAGFGGSQAYFDAIAARVRGALGENCRVLDAFLCQGRMPAPVRARWAAALEKDPADARAKQMVENFDAALSHPDEADLAALRRWVEKGADGELSPESAP